MSVSWRELLGRLKAGRARRARLARGASEAGFTIPELLIAAFLVAAAAGLIATAIYQIFYVSRHGSARLATLSDLENSATWLGRDVSEAVSFTPGSGTVYGTLTTSDPTVQYRYSYDSSNTALVRELLVSGSPNSTTRIARRIASQGDVSFSLSSKLLTVAITASSGPVSESATLKLAMRAQ